MTITLYRGTPRGFTAAIRGPADVLWWVHHHTDNGASPQDEAHYAATRTDERRNWTSAHLYTGRDGNSVQGLSYPNEAWAAGPTGNRFGIHQEWVGHDNNPEPSAAFDRAAVDIAIVCAAWAIPTRQLTDDQVRRHERGHTTHRQLARVFGETDHTDPGPLFDLGGLLQRVAGHILTPPPNATTTTEEIVNALPLLQLGATGQQVANAQGLLVAHGYTLGTSGPHGDGIDRSWGPHTDAALRRFQAEHHVPASVRADGTGDGQLGEHTWAALLDVT